MSNSCKSSNDCNAISELDKKTGEPVFITKNGKNIARLTSPSVNKLSVLDSLVGIVPAGSGIDEETIREERLNRQ